MQRQKDVHSLTSARGVAASWVVLFHMSEVWKRLPLGPFERLVLAGWLAVPFFFVLSGYVIGLRYVRPASAWSVPEIARFLALRFGRIYPVHFVMILAIALVSARHGLSGAHSAPALVANLFLVQAWTRTLTLSWNWPSWSISAEWFAYLLFPLFAVALWSAPRRWMIALAFLACVASAVVYGFTDVPYKALADVAPTFFGGMVLSQLAPPRRLLRASRFLVPLAVGLVVWSLLDQPAWLKNGVFIVLFFALVVALAADSPRSIANWRPLVFIGDISYSVYMTHAFTLSLFTRFIHLPASAEGSPWILFASASAMVLAVYAAALIMYYFVERPSRAASRRVVARLFRERATQQLAGFPPA